MTTAYVLYGMAGSLYTAKVRSYLRKQRVAFEERVAGDPRFEAEAIPAVGRWIIPVVKTPLQLSHLVHLPLTGTKPEDLIFHLTMHHQKSIF